MKIDVGLSVYHETPSARAEFNRKELRRCRYMLRRLRFLEAQVRDSTGTNDGAMHAEWEIEALEWLLTEVGFLSEERTQPATADKR